MLSMHDSEQFLFESLKAGASGYVLKSNADQDIVEAVRRTMRARHRLTQAVGDPAPLLALEPLELLAQPLESFRRDHQFVHLAPSDCGSIGEQPRRRAGSSPSGRDTIFLDGAVHERGADSSA
jgi:hypothetical protein